MKRGSRVLFGVSLSLMCLNAYSQKQTEKWYFGANAGLDFSSGTPVEFTGSAMSMLEGVSSIADSNGNTLFYTNGLEVWNANNLQMPNGSGLMGDNNSAQSALIVPDPGNPLEYYIFTTPADGSSPMHYSKVDMSLQAGLGDVTSKNVFLFNNSTEKVTAAAHGNGNDIWVVGHEFGSNNFYSFLVTDTGINTTPVITSTGSVVSVVPAYQGYMKLGHHGHKIAYCSVSMDIVEVLDFDNQTGIPSNSLTITVNEPYGIEFSPDDSKLYCSAENPKILYQWDLNAGSAAAILASQVVAGPQIGNEAFASLQLGPDGKIYLANRISSKMGVINFPNLAGTACDFIDNVMTLSNFNQYGLPNFYQSYFDTASVQSPLPNVAFVSSDTSFCEKSCLDFTDLSTNSPTSWQWLFPGADSTSSNLQNPTGICYSSYGSFDVTLIACNGNGCDTLVISNFIHEFQNPPVPVVTSNADTLFSTQAYSYQWYDSAGAISGANGNYYVHQHPGFYYVVVADSNGCATASNVIGTGINEWDFLTDWIKVFPNPSHGVFEIQFRQATREKAVVEIRDLQGRLVKMLDIDPGVTILEMDMRDNTAGIYLLHIISGKQSFVRKILISGAVE